MEIERNRIEVERLKDIEKKTQLLIESMEILHNLITDQEKSIYDISDAIDNSNSEVNKSIEMIDSGNTYSYKHYYLYAITTIIGGLVYMVIS